MTRTLIACVLMLMPLAAQDVKKLGSSHDTPIYEKIDASIKHYGTSPKLGGFGWIRVKLFNPGPQSHEVDVRFRRESYRRAIDFNIGKTITLDPDQRAVIDLPFPSFARAGRVHFNIDGYKAGYSAFIGMPRHARGVSVLVLAGTGSSLRLSKSWFVGLIKSSSGVVKFESLLPADLPSAPWMLSCFDLIVVDERCNGLDQQPQMLLRQYLRLGGRLMMVNASAAAAGSLATVRERATRIRENYSEGTFGFGTWLAISGGLKGQLEGIAERWLTKQPPTLLSEVMSAYGGPVSDDNWMNLQIPGFGDVPARLFFILIFCFTIVVGPINYMWCVRKRRQPLLMLATTPIAGIGLTVLILSYGMFSEGFGIKGACRSITILDQRSHEAVTWTSQTLYAGIAPAKVVPREGTWLMSPQFIESGRSALDNTYELNLNKGFEFDGDLLPSRSLTTIVTAATRPARERLRFRHKGSEGLEVLASPDLAPRVADGMLLVRDFAGRYFYGSNGKTLKLVTNKPRITSLLNKSTRIQCREQQRGVPFMRHVQHEVIDGKCYLKLPEWLNDRLANSMEPGSYLASVERPSFHESLGLDTEYLVEKHLVFGTLSAEDFVD